AMNEEKLATPEVSSPVSVETARKPAAADAAPPLTANADAAGRVRLRWGDGDDGRVLRRRFLGKDGTARDGLFVEVRRLPGAAGDCVDDIPGGSGVYAWSVGGSSPVRVEVQVPVEIELL